MQIDTDDLVPSSELTRNTAHYVREAAEGRRFIIINNSVPKAALVSIDDLKLLEDIIKRRGDYSDSPNTRPPNVSTYLDVLGIENIDTYDPAARWAQNTDATTRRAALTAPIGLTDTAVFVLDVTDERGTVLVGSTGSGKSSVLTLLQLSLCAMNSPKQLRILHVDFVGGLGHDVERGLPHVELLARRWGKGLPQIGEKDDFMRTVIDRITELMDLQSAFQTTVGRPHLVILLDECPRGNEEFAELVKTLLTTGPSLNVHLVMSAQALTADEDPTPGPGARVALRQNNPRAARAILGKEPYPPLKQGEAAVASHQGTGTTRIRLFDPRPHYSETQVPDNWMELLSARIRIATDELEEQHIVLRSTDIGSAKTAYQAAGELSHHNPED